MLFGQTQCGSGMRLAYDSEKAPALSPPGTGELKRRGAGGAREGFHIAPFIEARGLSTLDS